MSKITFRADDALVEQLDALDASKSEVMREALREFLDRHPEVGTEREMGTEREVTPTPEVRVDEGSRGTAPELTLNISFDGAEAAVDGAGDAIVDRDGENACKHCGAAVSPEHSFCPSCGEEHRHQPRCECGEEIRSDWTFCPGCGRRSPASDVFDHA